MKASLLFVVIITISTIAFAKEQTPYEKAIRSNNVEEVSKLISKGKDVNQIFGYFDQPAINLTVGFNESYDVLSLLLKNGAKVDAVDKDNATSLIKASQFASPKAVKLLLKYGANPNHIDKDGGFPLLAAVNSGNIDKVKLLLDNGADVNLRTGKLTFGYSPLIAAVIKNNIEITKLLIKYGADVKYKSSDGDALTIAKLMKHNKIISILEKVQ